MMGFFRKLWRLATRRIGFRFFAVHLLVLFLPIGGLIVFDRYEQQLLRQQEQSMEQQARLLATVLSVQLGSEGVAGASDSAAGSEASLDRAALKQAATGALNAFAGRNISRLRVLDAQAQLLADTSVDPADGGAVASFAPLQGAAPSAKTGSPRAASPGASSAGATTRGPTSEDRASPTIASPTSASLAESGTEKASVRQRWLYRIGAFPFRVIREVLGDRPSERYEATALAFNQRDEVQAALGGNYGARSRTDGDRLLLHVAVPISVGTARSGTAATVGVVLVSRSTDRARALVYSLRLFLFKIFLASVALSVVVNLLLAGTIERPLRRLNREAAELVDRRGRLRGEFSKSGRVDEIGDLTRSLWQMAAGLRQQQQRTEEFVADLSHELKNPLAAIRTALELDASERGGASATDDIAQRNVARMERLISDLAELSRIEAGVATAGAQVDAAVVVAETANAWARMHRRQIDLRINVDRREFELSIDPEQDRVGDGVGDGVQQPPPPCAILADPDHIVRILQNLLDNAGAHAESTLPIDVALVGVNSDAGGGAVTLTVRDRGPGIARGEEERVFERFYSRRRGTASPNATNTAPQGLGLAVVRALSHAYGGSATARTVEAAEGGGALFQVSLQSLPS